MAVGASADSAPMASTAPTASARRAPLSALQRGASAKMTPSVRVATSATPRRACADARSSVEATAVAAPAAPARQASAASQTRARSRRATASPIASAAAVEGMAAAAPAGAAHQDNPATRMGSAQGPRALTTTSTAPSARKVSTTTRWLVAASSATARGRPEAMQGRVDAKAPMDALARSSSSSASCSLLGAALGDRLERPLRASSPLRPVPSSHAGPGPTRPS